jgi:hypothetical protein
MKPRNDCKKEDFKGLQGIGRTFTSRHVNLTLYLL